MAWKAIRRTTGLGVLIGGTLRALRWSKEYLREHAAARAHELEQAAAEGRAEVVRDKASENERLARGGEIARARVGAFDRTM